MANYKEIVTKAVISKGKKLFKTSSRVNVDKPSTVLGCWVINHNYSGSFNGNKIVIDGSYDVNIWYSYDNDTKTDVVKDTNTYHEIINMRDVGEIDGEEIIVRSLKQPNCVKAEIDGNSIIYEIEKELGIELVGDVKVKIQTDDEEEQWDEIVEDNSNTVDSTNHTIDDVVEDYIDDKQAI